MPARLMAAARRVRAAFADVDWRGEKVSAAALKGKPDLRQPKRASTQFGADPEKLVSLFKKADEGDPRELQALLAEVEARDSHIGGVLDTRYKAAVRVPWRAVAGTDDARDVEIAEAVQRDIYDAAWFRPMLGDLLGATTKGWAVSSITWQTGDAWRPIEVRAVDQSLTAVDPLDDQRLQWRDPADLTKLQPIAPYAAIVHAASSPSGPLFRRGLGRALAILYSLKRLGLQAFATFVELYGVARPVVSYLDGVTTEQLDQLQTDLEEWQSAGYLMKPRGVNVEFPEPTRDSTGDPVHVALAKFCDEQASKRIVGQTMTSDAGSSRSQAEVHERVAEHILEGDVLALVATVVRDLVTPYVRLNYGADVAVPQCVPQLEQSGRKAFALEVLKVAVPLGLRVEQSVVRDLGGFPEPEDGAEVLAPPASATATPSPGTSTGAARERRQAAATRGPAAFGPGVLYARPAPPPERQRTRARPAPGAFRARVAAAPAPASRRDHLRAEAGELEAMLAEMPARRVIERAGLEHRLAETRSKLASEASEDDFMDTDGGAAAAAVWREGMQPFVDGVQAAADGAEDFDGFLTQLREETSIDGDKLVRSLATWTMQARGVGDGTDDT
jgi:phage gp29-like protein